MSRANFLEPRPYCINFGASSRRPPISTRPGARTCRECPGAVDEELDAEPRPEAETLGPLTTKRKLSTALRQNLAPDALGHSVTTEAAMHRALGQRPLCATGRALGHLKAALEPRTMASKQACSEAGRAGDPKQSASWKFAVRPSSRRRDPLPAEARGGVCRHVLQRTAAATGGHGGACPLRRGRAEGCSRGGTCTGLSRRTAARTAGSTHPPTSKGPWGITTAFKVSMRGAAVVQSNLRTDHWSWR